MRVQSVSSAAKRKTADLLVLPFWAGKKSPRFASSAESSTFAQLYKVALKTGDFTGKNGESLLLYTSSKQEPRVLLIGLGDQKELGLEQLRRAYSQALKDALGCKAKKMNVIVPTQALDEKTIVRGIVEGIVLANYRFDQLKVATKQKDSAPLLETLTLVGCSAAGSRQAQDSFHISDSVHFTRDLIMGNADDVTPQYLAKVARSMGREFPKVKTSVFDKKRLEKEKMGLILAVNRGSPRPPVLIAMEYKGNPRSKDHTVLVGKGITFDTGGLNLKPTGSMENMRKDMSGAACALGVMRAVATLGLKVNLTVLVPSTENGIDGNAYKPGDVYVGYGGKSVEIGNTDAEGRLVLADAIAYAAKKLKPTRILDIATLTGAVIIGLGHHATGMMSNDDDLAEAFSKAGQETYERVWRLPLFEEYRKQLDSEVADIKSTGGRGGGSITAAFFLKEFVGDIPWVHFDIAGTSWGDVARHYNPRFAAGIGTRLIVEFLQQLK